MLLSLIMLYKILSVLYISCVVVCDVCNGDRVKFSGGSYMYTC